MFDESVDQTIVCIGALMVASDSLEARVFGNTQCQSIFLAQFLQLGKYAVGDDWGALGVETIHHGRNDIQFVLNGVGDEVGVNKNGIRGGEGRVILEEKRRWRLRPRFGRLSSLSH